MHSLQFDFAGKARQEIRLDPQGTLMLEMYVLRTLFFHSPKEWMGASSPKTRMFLEQEACEKKADVEAARVKKQKETQIGNYLWDVLREEGVPEDDLQQLQDLGWKEFGITNKLGNKLREILIKRTGLTANEIVDEYFPPTVISFGSGSRQMDDDGDGPGVVWNFLVCLAISMAGIEMPMTGLLVAQGDFYAAYIKCVNKKSAEALEKPVATHMIVLLSQAFTQSAMCMVEVSTAIESGINLVLVNVEEPIDWRDAWESKSMLARYPFINGGGKVNWGAAKFATNRAAVIDRLTSDNSYPRQNIFPGMNVSPANGNIAKAWGENGGCNVLSWIVKEIGGSSPSLKSAHNEKEDKIIGEQLGEFQPGVSSTPPAAAHNCLEVEGSAKMLPNAVAQGGAVGATSTSATVHSCNPTLQNHLTRLHLESVSPLHPRKGLLGRKNSAQSIKVFHSGISTLATQHALNSVLFFSG